MAKPTFLTAHWSNLLMLNYEVDPGILSPFLPAATELDLWQGRCLVSMVGFLFRETRVLGVKWPFHVNFEEVNLRFYVKHFDGKTWKRGAVFVSEIVPKSMIAAIANNLYKEHYQAMPMRHSIEDSGSSNRFLYEWKFRGRWNKLGATVSKRFEDMLPDSQEEFIFEHYWGYNPVGPSATTEYAVEHVSWQVADVSDYIFDADIAGLYGKSFEPYLSVKPYSAFFANGSAVSVRMGNKIVL